jgi:uncharacterized protein YutE (UPF0331/DUF86 family)
MGKAAWLLQLIREHVGLLEAKVEELGADKLIEDAFLFYAVLHALQVASQALINLAAHVAAEAGLCVPERYAALPELLARAGALGEGEATTLRRIIGFRNIVVHGYAGVSRQLVRGIMAEHKFRDLEELALRVVEWARARGVDP